MHIKQSRTFHVTDPAKKAGGHDASVLVSCHGASVLVSCHDASLLVSCHGTAVGHPGTAPSGTGEVY